MIKPIYYLYLSISSVLLGVIFYSFYNELIVIKFASKQSSYTHDFNIHKKNFTLIYFNGINWVKEEKELIQSPNKIKTATYLVTSWLNLLTNEKIISHPVQLQSILLDGSGKDIFISLQQTLFNKNDSIRHKLSIIQSLLATLRENKLGIQSVRLMINNSTFEDPHLDFSVSWPVEGFK